MRERGQFPTCQRARDGKSGGSMNIVVTLMLLAASSAWVRADTLRVLNINMWGLGVLSEYNKERFAALAGRSQEAENSLEGWKIKRAFY